MSDFTTDNPIFPANDQLDQETLISTDPENRRNGGYEPTREEISKECAYLIGLTEK